MNHQFEMHLQEAIDTVAAWDISNEEFANAVNCQARLMSGLSPSDEHWFDDSDNPIQ